MKSIGCKLPTCMNCTIKDCGWEEAGIEAYNSTDEFYFLCEACRHVFPLCPYQELHPSAGGGGWFVCAECAEWQKFGGGFIEGGFLV